MALTHAEKQKRYRERLRAENPERHELAKKKNAERNKKRKKIADCSEEEKEKERKKWRDRKKRQKGEKCNNDEASTSTNEKNDYCNDMGNVDVVQKARLAERRKNQRNWALERKQYEDKIKQLRKTIRTLRKKVNRCQKKIEELKIHNTEIFQEPFHAVANETTPKNMTPATKSESFIEKNLPDIPAEHKEAVKKQLLTHNILLDSLQNTYKKATTNTERNILKNIVDNDIVRKYKSKTLMARYLGLKGKIRRNRDRKTSNNKTLNELRLFYERDDVSRMTAGKKEYRVFKKRIRQTRYLLGTLKHLYQKYRSEGGKLKYSTFKKCRPFYVLPPKLTNRETCACVKHENVIMKCKKIQALGMIQTSEIEKLVSEIVCDTKAKDCAYGDCIVCKNKHIKLSWEEKDSKQMVSWQEWNLVKHEYKEKGDSKKLRVTKRMVKNLKSGTLKELIDLFNKELQDFKKHIYNIKHQYKQYSTCLKNLTDKEIAIHIDFSENWICKLATEVQSMHFGASQIQITIQTGVLYSKDKQTHKIDPQSQSFATISSSNEHGPEAIWAHLAPILEHVKIKYSNVNRIHFFSDGPSTQYRQKKIFYFFTKITKEMGFISSTWNFSESSHGKGAADGVGAAIKRKLDDCVSRGKDIPDALTAFNVLQEGDTEIMLYYISQADIDNYKAPTNLKPVPGTMQLHQITNTDVENVIHYRSLSCFCSMSIYSGYCKCLDLKSHLLTSSCENNPEKELKVNDDEINAYKDLKRKKLIKPKQNKTKENNETTSSGQDKKRKLTIKALNKNEKRKRMKISKIEESESSTTTTEDIMSIHSDSDIMDIDLDEETDYEIHCDNKSPKLTDLDDTDIRRNVNMIEKEIFETIEKIHQEDTELKDRNDSEILNKNFITDKEHINKEDQNPEIERNIIYKHAHENIWRKDMAKKEEEEEKKKQEKENLIEKGKEKKISTKEEIHKNKTKKIKAIKKAKAQVKKRNIRRQQISNSSSKENDTNIEYQESEHDDLKEFLDDEINQSETEDNVHLSVLAEKKYKKDLYVIITYEGEYFPGLITNIEDGQYEISSMVLSKGNTFRWPETIDKIWYSKKSIIEVIEEPIKINKRGVYRVKEMEKYLSFIS